MTFDDKQTNMAKEDFPFDTEIHVRIANIPPVFLRSEKSYLEMLECFQSVCEEMKTQEVVDCNELKRYVDNIIAILAEDERMLLNLANAPYPFIQRKVKRKLFEPISIHGVNAMIYSLKISKDIGISESRLPYVGIATLCGHLGLLDIPFEKLNNSNSMDNAKILEYELENKKYIKKIKIDNFHLDSIELLNTMVRDEKQILSRTTLKEGMYQYAMVIHLCNEFERQTHQKAYTPINAMKKMRGEMDSFFHPDIIKLFFNKLSIYPLGSFVKLSSEETAKIVKINENFIMRPIVIVVLDNEDREKEKPVRINLREKFNLHIKHAIVNDALTERYLYLF